MTRWVLLRGWTREVAHWGSFPDELAMRLGAGHEVQAIDLPGSGRWHDQRCPPSVPAMADACRAQVDAHQPVVLVALSLGAMVALQWCRAAPGSVAGCVLINTSAGAHSPFWDRLRPAQYLRVLRMLGPGLSASERERQILAMTSAVPDTHGDLGEHWARVAAQRPVSRSNALRQLLAAAQYRAPGAPPPVSGLLLASRGDRLVSLRCSQRLSSTWGWPLATHPWAGHDLPLDDPAWVIDALDRWRHTVI